MLELRGRVATGIADLAGWITLHADAYMRATGSTLVPGSLNIVIERSWVMRTPAIRLDASEVGVGVGLLPCRVGGIAGWIFRTDRNNLGDGDHAMNVLEVVAAVHLRAALGLRDGDEITVEIDE